MLLPPAILYNKLSSIQNQLIGQDLELPLEIKRDNLLNFYHMAYTRSRIIDNHCRHVHISTEANRID